MKQQLLTEQDDADAIVAAAVADAQQRIDHLTNDLATWQAAVQAKEAEVANLQAALGELTFESEAAERLRAELRMAHDATAAADQQAAALRLAVSARETEAAEARAMLQQAQAQVEEEARARKRLVDECLSMRKTLQEHARQAVRDESSSVDKRVVGQLLVTYLQRRGRAAHEVLAVLCSVLGVDLKRDLKAGLGDQWMEFLLSEVGESGGGGVGGAEHGGGDVASSKVDDGTIQGGFWKRVGGVQQKS